MCEDFVLSNVKIVIRAIGEYVKSTGKSDRGVVIGYDTRFFSDKFADWAAGVLADNGIPSYLSAEDVPTPVVAYAIKDLGAAGGVMFTASHNPPEYNGIKFIPENSAPATPETTKKIEGYVKGLKGQEITVLGKKDRKSTRLNSSHTDIPRMPSSA